jgi:nucleoside-diphosphate-sugar epimerase
MSELVQTVTPLPGRYLITGASGFIGTHFVQRLIAAQCEVHMLDLSPPTVIPTGVRYVRCDLRDRSAVSSALKKLPVDYVIHLAARVGDWGSFKDFEDINVTGTKNVLEASCEAGAKRVVHLSSIAAMGLDAGDLADESVGPFTSGDAYCATKGAGENVAREMQRTGAAITVIRPGDVYGVGSVPWVVRPVELLRKQQMVLVNGGCGHFAHVHVDNLIDGILLSLDNPQALGETLILTDGDTQCTIGEYFTRLADAAGVKRPTRSVPRVVAKGIGWIMEAAAHITQKPPAFTRNAVDFVLRRGSFRIEKARQMLGWTPRISLDEGLAQIAAHYKNNP